VAAALAEAGQAGQAAEAAGQALQAAAGIDDPQWRARRLNALLTNSVVCTISDGDVGRRALELLLFTSNAPDYLAAFPVALLRRLVANGEFVAAERQPADPAAVTATGPHL
jgi:hypothetical protein